MIELAASCLREEGLTENEASISSVESLKYFENEALSNFA
jgi:hypothetical protein